MGVKIMLSSKTHYPEDEYSGAAYDRWLTDRPDLDYPETSLSEYNEDDLIEEMTRRGFVVFKSRKAGKKANTRGKK
jgi:hypothetical protein